MQGGSDEKEQCHRIGCGGHPAHLHPNGVCPYSSAGKAGTGSSSSSGTAAQKQAAVPTPTQAAVPETDAVLMPAQEIASGWCHDEDGWKYYYADLTFAKGKWEAIGDKYYCFADDGHLYVSTVTPDGYWVNENGEWVR